MKLKRYTQNQKAEIHALLADTETEVIFVRGQPGIVKVSCDTKFRNFQVFKEAMIGRLFKGGLLGEEEGGWKTNGRRNDGGWEMNLTVQWEWE